MKTFKSLEEIQPYYNENTNTYEFIENGMRLDVKFEFDLMTDSNIFAQNIDAWDIDAWDIDAWDIDAWDIDAGDISYYAVCVAYISFACHSVQGRRKNSRHFCLDGEIEYKTEEEGK